MAVPPVEQRVPRRRRREQRAERGGHDDRRD
jgi:hypothetical protein